MSGEDKWPPTRYRNDGKAAFRLSAIQRDYRDVVLNKLASGAYHMELVRTCLCGETKALAIAEKDRFGIPVGIVACSSCGLVRTSPRLAADDLLAFYNDDYHGLHMGIPDPTPTTDLFRAGQGLRIYDYLRGYLPPGFLRVAEVGCGTGQVLRDLARAAAADGRQVTVVGCEYAKRYVAAGRLVGTDVREGGPREMLDAAPVDLVILSHVLEHFADVSEDLSVIRQLGHEGTLVYVEVPGFLSVHRKREYSYDLLHYLTLAHTYHFSLGTLTDTMFRAGFSFVEGSEEVRSVFRLERAEWAGRSLPDEGRLELLVQYIHWLEGSRRLRLRRLLGRIEKASRALASNWLKVLLSDRQYAAIRARIVGGPRP